MFLIKPATTRPATQTLPLLSAFNTDNKHADVYQLHVVMKSPSTHRDIPLYRNCFNRIIMIAQTHSVDFCKPITLSALLLWRPIASTTSCTMHTNISQPWNIFSRPHKNRSHTMRLHSQWHRVRVRYELCFTRTSFTRTRGAFTVTFTHTKLRECFAKIITYSLHR